MIREKDSLQNLESTIVEISINSKRILHHLLKNDEVLPFSRNFIIIPTTSVNLPVFTSDFYYANIGSEANPLLLELRFEKIDAKFTIALLMTNERLPRDLIAISTEIIKRTEAMNIEFDAVIGPESMGAKLAQEIARQRDEKFFWTSLQKGKIKSSKDRLVIGSPKPWVDEDAGIEVISGTSDIDAKQMLYLDQKILDFFIQTNKKVLWVDDARLTSGTLDGSLKLLQAAGLQLTGVVTVLNENKPDNHINGIPYIWLTKLPLFQGKRGRLKPVAGTYNGLDNFYITV